MKKRKLYIWGEKYACSMCGLGNLCAYANVIMSSKPRRKDGKKRKDSVVTEPCMSEFRRYVGFLPKEDEVYTITIERTMPK